MESLALSVDATLEVEEGADKQLQLAYGDRWVALPSAQLNADAREELSILRMKLNAAADANASLRAAFAARQPLLAPLSLPYATLEQQIPQRAQVCTSPLAVVRALRPTPNTQQELKEMGCTRDVETLLQSVQTTAKAIGATLVEAKGLASEEEMKILTDQLMCRLRHHKSTRFTGPTVPTTAARPLSFRCEGAAAGGSNDEVIEQALEKLSKYKDRMREEAAQQESLLGALRTANEVFTLARFVHMLQRRPSVVTPADTGRFEDSNLSVRQNYFAGLSEAARAYEEIEGLLHQGRRSVASTQRSAPSHLTLSHLCCSTQLLRPSRSCPGHSAQACDGLGGRARTRAFRTSIRNTGG